MTELIPQLQNLKALLVVNLTDLDLSSLEALDNLPEGYNQEYLVARFVKAILEQKKIFDAATADEMTELLNVTKLYSLKLEDYDPKDEKWDREIGKIASNPKIKDMRDLLLSAIGAHSPDHEQSLATLIGYAANYLSYPDIGNVLAKAIDASDA